jgi:type III secretion protein V
MTAAPVAQGRQGLAGRFADAGLIVGVIAIVAMMILPLPAPMIDLLVGINIAMGVLLLLTTLYIRSPLDFSSFPSLLLIFTLFRLALAIATTRMILLEGHAGDIIQTFGQMVAGNNLIVGLVVFLIITVVQFIVIAKGAERVAEVAARFSLDAMPGKQLSIDSDLRSGLIDKDEARRKRRMLEAESKMHGSLDGAMKFVKGDAIASIIIVIVNLLGGLAVGMLQNGMPFGDAMHKYSILTIGDGLVTQIPALLSAMAAGMIVTRATSEEDSDNLGTSIQKQLSSKPQVLIYGGIIALLMALVPGFPWMVFAGVACLLLAAGLMGHPDTRPHVERLLGPLRGAVRRGPEATPTALVAAAPEPGPLVPLLLELALAEHDAARVAALGESFTAMLATQQDTSGIPMPRMAVRIRPAADSALHWELRLYEVSVGSGRLAADAPPAEVAAAVRAVLRRHLAAFLGVQEATALLNRVGQDYPEVVKEAVRAVPTTRIADVLRRLIEEEVPLRNMRDVLEGLAEAGQQEREAGAIADLTRVAIRRYLLAAHATDGGLTALVVAGTLEERLRAAARPMTGGARIAMEPAELKDLVQALRSAVEATGAQVLITAFDIRRPLRKLIEADLFDLPVLSFNELTPAVRLEVKGQVDVPRPLLTDRDADKPVAPAADADEPVTPAADADGPRMEAA